MSFSKNKVKLEKKIKKIYFKLNRIYKNVLLIGNIKCSTCFGGSTHFCLKLVKNACNLAKRFNP